MVIQFFENGKPVMEPFDYEDTIFAEGQLTEEDTIEALDVGEEAPMGFWTVKRLS